MGTQFFLICEVKNQNIDREYKYIREKIAICGLFFKLKFTREKQPL